jgi:hypothetical protein
MHCATALSPSAPCVFECCLEFASRPSYPSLLRHATALTRAHGAPAAGAAAAARALDCCAVTSRNATHTPPCAAASSWTPRPARLRTASPAPRCGCASVTIARADLHIPAPAYLAAPLPDCICVGGSPTKTGPPPKLPTSCVTKCDSFTPIAGVWACPDGPQPADEAASKWPANDTRACTRGPAGTAPRSAGQLCHMCGAPW